MVLRERTENDVPFPSMFLLFCLPFFRNMSWLLVLCWVWFKAMWITKRGKSEVGKSSAQLKTGVGKEREEWSREDKRSAGQCHSQMDPLEGQPEGHSAVWRGEVVVILIELCYNNKHWGYTVHYAVLVFNWEVVVFILRHTLHKMKFTLSVELWDILNVIITRAKIHSSVIVLPNSFCSSWYLFFLHGLFLTITDLLYFTKNHKVSVAWSHLLRVIFWEETFCATSQQFLPFYAVQMY